MRIIYNNKTAGILSESARSRLRRTSFEDVAPQRKTEEHLPHQLVSAKCGRVNVTKADGSIVIAILHNKIGVMGN
jgi:hypothetical protein